MPRPMPRVGSPRRFVSWNFSRSADRAGHVRAPDVAGVEERLVPLDPPVHRDRALAPAPLAVDERLEHRVEHPVEAEVEEVAGEQRDPRLAPDERARADELGHLQPHLHRGLLVEEVAVVRQLAARDPEAHPSAEALELGQVGEHRPEAGVLDVFGERARELGRQPCGAAARAARARRGEAAQRASVRTSYSPPAAIAIFACGQTLSGQQPRG